MHNRITKAAPILEAFCRPVYKLPLHLSFSSTILPHFGIARIMWAIGVRFWRYLLAVSREFFIFAYDNES